MVTSRPKIDGQPSQPKGTTPSYHQWAGLSGMARHSILLCARLNKNNSFVRYFH
jgi:hypothetical protein